MPEIPAWAFLSALVFLGLLVWYSLLPLWMYNRVRGIEKALWAMVWEMKHGKVSHVATEQPVGPDGPGESLPPSAHIFRS